MTQLRDLFCHTFHRLSAHPRTGPEGTFQQCFGSDGMSCGRSVRSRIQFPPLEVPFTDSERDFLLWESRVARRRDGKG